MAMGDKGGGYNRHGYLAFAIPFAVVSAVLFLLGRNFLSSSLSSLVESGGDGAGSRLIGAGGRLGLLPRLVAYFGPAAMALSVPAFVLGRGIVPDRALRFFTCLAVVPILELLVVHALGLVYALWYQAFIGLAGVSTLAAVTLHSLRQRGYTVLYRVAVFAVLATSLPLLFSYYTTMHGDRPRLKEAAQFVQATIRDGGGTQAPPLLYSSAPGVVAFYLGVDPSVTMTQTAVRGLEGILSAAPERDAWFIVEYDAAPVAVRDWLVAQCPAAATFEAHSGPRDRSVFVHRCSPASERRQPQEK
jgi:hypothetical protein